MKAGMACIGRLDPTLSAMRAALVVPDLRILFLVAAGERPRLPPTMVRHISKGIERPLSITLAPDARAERACDADGRQ
ncbi:MAG TPA: hypothetical protein VNX29_05375 [Kaistia sp.]|nr:hypothetical protein [Kaistia sp.]